jgi:hypothetical protein
MNQTLILMTRQRELPIKRRILREAGIMAFDPRVIHINFHLITISHILLSLVPQEFTEQINEIVKQ